MKLLGTDIAENRPNYDAHDFLDYMIKKIKKSLHQANQDSDKKYP